MYKLSSGKLYFWLVVAWCLLTLVYQPAMGLFQYTAAELHRLRLHLSAPLPDVLHLYPDIAFLPRRRYIHRGSRRSAHQGSSTQIKSIWSHFRRPPQNTGRTVSHRVLANLARSANTDVRSENIKINFGLLNIRSLTSKGHLVQDVLSDRNLDFLCLTETWQQPNDFTQLNESTPGGFVYACQPRGGGRGGGLAMIYRESLKISPVPVPSFSSFESAARPTVAVLWPSRDELQKGPATVLCVASKGFPSDWTLSWKVGDSSRSSGVNVSPSELQEDGLYSWSSSLSLTESEWSSATSISCDATHPSQHTVSHKIQTRQCHD